MTKYTHEAHIEIMLPIRKCPNHYMNKRPTNIVQMHAVFGIDENKIGAQDP